MPCDADAPARVPAPENPQRNAPGAFDEVQTTPSRSPQKALIAAVEFIYVIGVMPSPASLVKPAATSCSQQFSTWVISAMSAMEHPALRSGRIVTCPGWLNTS